MTQVPAPVKPAGTPFEPGHAKVGGRAPGTLNRDRKLSIERINQEADPIGFLCRIVNGESFEGPPDPETGLPTLVCPTLADRIAAAGKLANKVLPDLKAVSVDATGNTVFVELNLAPSATAAVVLPSAPPPETEAP